MHYSLYALLLRKVNKLYALLPLAIFPLYTQIYTLLGDCVIDAFHYHTKDGVPVSRRGWSRMHALIDSFIQGSVR